VPGTTIGSGGGAIPPIPSCNSSTERNMEVLRRAGESRTVVDTSQNNNWVGHVMRGKGLLGEVMEGSMLS